MPQIPAIVQLLVVFAIVVAATARRIHLGLAAAAGGVVLAFWRGMGLRAVAAGIGRELFSIDLALLIFLMAAIMVFSSAMKRSGGMDAFARSIDMSIPSRRVATAVAPLVIGTLPMPGGAIISAPLIQAMNTDGSHDDETLSAANYWFRHNLELIWPLYPSFILTASLTGFSFLKLAGINLYSPPLLFLFGMLFILPRRKKSSSVDVVKAPWDGKSFLKGIAPLALVLGGYALLDFIFGLVSPGLSMSDETKALAKRYLPVLVAIGAGCILVARTSPGTRVFEKAIDKGTVKLLAVIVGIQVFSALIDETGIAHIVADELARFGIPAVLAIAIIPFIAGLVTGVGFGYVGLTLPIVMGLVPAGGPFPREAAIALAMAFGYSGMMLSPLHVCMVVSAEHFHTGLAAIMRRFALPLGLYMTSAVAYVALLAAVL